MGGLGRVLGLVVFVAMPGLTYILLTIDTWRQGSSILSKLLQTFVLDPILSGLWPVTWIWWLIDGEGTPLQTVLGWS